MNIKAYNTKTKKTEEISSIDFQAKTIHLVQHKSNSKFIYREKLDNVILLQEISIKDIQKTDKTTIYVAHKDI